MAATSEPPWQALLIMDLNGTCRSMGTSNVREGTVHKNVIIDQVCCLCAISMITASAYGLLHSCGHRCDGCPCNSSCYLGGAAHLIPIPGCCMALCDSARLLCGWGC
jgi:hypothetical protein